MKKQKIIIIFIFCFMNFELPNYERVQGSLSSAKEKVRGKEACLAEENTSTKFEGQICEGIAKKAIFKEKKKSASVKKSTCTLPKCDPSRIKVLNITYPQPISPEAKTSKRFSLTVDYYLHPDKENVLRKKINFGEKGITERIDSEKIDPLDPHFYRINLLSKCPTIKEAYLKLCETLL
jgi:hypothetical protein